jgi:hypothetical protein
MTTFAPPAMKEVRAQAAPNPGLFPSVEHEKYRAVESHDGISFVMAACTSRLGAL